MARFLSESPIPGPPTRAGDPKGSRRSGAAGISGAGSDAGSSRGSHWSHEGRYQFHSPSSFIVAGRSTARTIVASIRIAAASPMPNCLKNSIERAAKIEKTKTITTAALVTTPAVRLIPFEIASSMVSPPSYSSLIRPRTRTW